MSDTDTPRTDAVTECAYHRTDAYTDVSMRQLKLTKLCCQLERELAQAWQDAERYRWLRSHSWLEKGDTPALFFGAGCDQTAPQCADDAIDAAMKEGK